MFKGNFINNLPKIYGTYTGGFIVFIILMAIGEQAGMSAKVIGICFVAFTVLIYALIGFCMVNEMDSPYGRYDIPPGLYLFMIIWLALGFLGILEMFGFGAVANFAHLGGLISGIMFAVVYKFFPLNWSN